MTADTLERVLIVADGIPRRNPWSRDGRSRTALRTELADRVYGDNTGGELERLGIDYNPKDGFAAALYELYERDGQYYLAFRGSENEWADWRNNGAQAIAVGVRQTDTARVKEWRQCLPQALDRPIPGVVNPGGASDEESDDRHMGSNRVRMDACWVCGWV